MATPFYGVINGCGGSLVTEIEPKQWKKVEGECALAAAAGALMKVLLLDLTKELLGTKLGGLGNRIYVRLPRRREAYLKCN